MAEDKKKSKQPPAPVSFEDKDKALETALGQIEKQFGKGAVMKLGEKTVMNVACTPTGSLGLDIALGVGGIPRGRIIEVYGPESSGKTTVALHMVAEVQRAGGIAGFIDAEHALDPEYAQKLGVDINNLYISQPDDGEQALEITETMVRSGAIDILVIDSVAALVPRAEIEGLMGDSHMALQARLMSQALRKLTAVTGRTRCTVIFINQIRSNLGPYGPREVTTGGKALKFYASVRLDVRKDDSIKVGSDIIGAKTSIKVAKNKVAPPFKTATFDIIYGQGISRTGELLDLAAELNIVNKSGAWYSYNETRLGQGRENAKLYFAANPEFCDEIENAVRKHFNLSPKNMKLENDDKESYFKSQSKKPEKGKSSKKKEKNEEAEETFDLNDSFILPDEDSGDISGVIPGETMEFDDSFIEEES